jgi:hypothetical protein
MPEGTTSRVMAADRPYEFYDFYSVSPEYFGYTLVEALLFRHFAQFAEDKRPIQLQNSGSVMAIAHGNSVQKYTKTLWNVKSTAEMLSAADLRRKSVRRNQLKHLRLD